MNTNRNHTPGPWEVVPSSRPGTGTRRRDIVSTGTVFNPSFIAGEALLEDARLISAAPELLATLAEAVDELEQMHRHYYGNCPVGCPACVAIDKARAAIAKATAE